MRKWLGTGLGFGVPLGRGAEGTGVKRTKGEIGLGSLSETEGRIKGIVISKSVGGGEKKKEN